MDYYYKDKSVPILTFPLVQYEMKPTFTAELSRYIETSKNIAIITLANNTNCLFVSQLNYNHIPFYLTDLTNIRRVLKSIKEKYTLVFTGPALITGDLNGTFINKFLELNTTFTFGGSVLETHKHMFLGADELKTNGFSTNLDSTVCFGYTYAISDFYSKYQEVGNKVHPYIKNNVSTECTLLQYYPDTLYKRIDAGNTLSYSIDFIHSKIKQVDDKYEIHEDEALSSNKRMF